MHQLISVKTEEKQVKNHICVICRRQFIDIYEKQGYSEEIKHECLEIYLNGLGFRAIERIKKVHHTTIINWVKNIGNELTKNIDYNEIPEITQVDELETFVGKKAKSCVRGFPPLSKLFKKKQILALDSSE